MPEFIEGDIFRTIVPLDDTYSYDFGAVERENADKAPTNIQIKSLSKQETLIVDYLQKNEKITTSKAEEVLGVKQRRAREILKELTKKEVLLKCGAYKGTVYVLDVKQIS